MSAALGEGPSRRSRTRVRVPPPPPKGVQETTPVVYMKPSLEVAADRRSVSPPLRTPNRRPTRPAVWVLDARWPRSRRA